MKNFASINPSLVFTKGSTLRTINPYKSVVGIATLDVEFPSEAVVYDMSRFLSTLNLYENPDIEFGDRFFTISEGKKKNTYVYADKSMVIAAPEKEPKIPAFDVEVKVDWNDLQSVIKAASVLQLPEIAVVGEDGKSYLKAINSKDKSADQFGVELGETEDTFVLAFKTENLKFLPFDYTVSLSSKGISKFVSDYVTYYVAVEVNSSSYVKG